MSGAGERGDELKAAQFVRDAVAVLVPRLVALFGLTQADATEKARDMVHDVCAVLGGQHVYISRDGNYGISARDREIHRRHNGTNTRALALEYGLTDVRIRQIHKSIVMEMRAKSQLQLPGLDSV